MNRIVKSGLLCLLLALCVLHVAIPAPRRREAPQPQNGPVRRRRSDRHAA